MIEVGTAIQAMAKKGEPLRVVIQRWRDPQLPLFPKPEYRYYVIATNRDDRSPVEVIRFHNERGQAENEIKELKIVFSFPARIRTLRSDKRPRHQGRQNGLGNR